MREVKEEKLIYIAFDGTRFDTMQKCLDYEEEFTNLAEETIDVLKEYDKTNKDILGVIVDNKYKIDFDNFLEITKDWFYDAGYGGDCPVMNWQIVGESWWLERWEYDGSSGWKYVEPPNLNKLELRKITKKDIIEGE